MATSTRPVRFLSRGIEVVGNLYVPSSTATDRKKAAIIVGHQGTGVKEQASGLYAKSLAENGFVALAFDAAYQGGSGGLPRNLEDPHQRTEDFRNAVTFLPTLDGEVDPDRIGVVGICASGGYGISAAQTDVRIRAIAAVVGVCWGGLTRDGLRKNGIIDKEALEKGLARAGQLRVDEARGAEPVSYNILDHFGEAAAKYYSTPQWQHPNCTNLQLVRSFDLLISYDSFEFVEWISPRPLLMITGSEAETSAYSQMVIDRAGEPKELFVVEGKTHTDLYQETEESVPKLVEVMDKWLCT
ncbi:DLH domain-containing protein [Fusarium sp. LHS14.1]|nr:DLH domain-containing protein [Fusarium sp. LHS14.1]